MSICIFLLGVGVNLWYSKFAKIGRFVGFVIVSYFGSSWVKYVIIVYNS